MGNNRALSWLIRVPGAVLVALAGIGLVWFGYVFIACTIDLVRSWQWLYALLAFTVFILLAIVGVTLLRVGWRMVRMVDQTTVSNFAFLFAYLIAYQLYRVMKGSWVEAQFTHKELLVFLALGLFFFYYWVIKKCLTSALQLNERRLG
ncbi:MAG: hypothetical protein B9S32_04105 [Verrucomicrobia bacterium Tous-C9LFEB]|nr:MAG: hypothetical protein B9S32_04105 [Verrucomicrobia bacterium Tous-C9LFEB]